MSLFKCPICSSVLSKKEKTYTCPKDHAFDCAKSGYVNLLQSQQARAKQHGDDALMLHARRDFLDKSYYKVLMDALNTIINQKGTQTILDAGCGEGWYCSAIEGEHTVYGIDISKSACDLSAKRNKTQHFAVGSTFDMPLLDKSMDVVYSVFAPFSSAEIKRVLKEEGRFIHVFPLQNHLLELKEAIYSEAYKNEGSVSDFEGFDLMSHEAVEAVITLETNQDIQNLFTMTPYVHRTSREEQAKLDALSTLETQVSFGVSVYTHK